MKNQWDEAKDEYEDTFIPPELEARVQEGIRQGKTNYRKKKAPHWVRRTTGTVAACFALLIGGLNVSPTFAAAAADVPVLGSVFQVLTVREFRVVEDDINYQVKVPEVEANGELAEKVNAEIQERVDAHLAECQQVFDEYKEAFFATGGTEEEWGDRQMDVIVDYEIKSQTDTTVSFVIDLFQGSFNAYNEQYYYNLDLEHDRDITLADLLGEDWVEICNQSIQEQIDASVDEDGFTYFFPADMGGFTTVDETTSFYINEEGQVVVVYPEYAIAAGAAGIVEFVIEPLINEKGRTQPAFFRWGGRNPVLFLFGFRWGSRSFRLGLFFLYVVF